jgi:bifunctional non-homologous end joining protein LigD
MSARFVIHEHQSSHLHYDFRLEMLRVLRSWAIPKGPSMDPTQKRLAMQVEDHPLEYIDFEGIIPKGMYGAGAVVVWDSGDYDLLEERKDRIAFVLKGKKLKGSFTLVRFKGKEREWLLIKQKDEYAQNGWKLKTDLTPKKMAELKERIPPCGAS